MGHECGRARLGGRAFSGTRFVAFSTLCVYPFSRVDGPGATPDDTPPTPVGEYANSCVARERYSNISRRKQPAPAAWPGSTTPSTAGMACCTTSPFTCLHGTPIDIRTGVANCIWQGDAISHILRCLSTAPCPPRRSTSGAAERPTSARPPPASANCSAGTRVSRQRKGNGLAQRLFRGAAAIWRPGDRSRHHDPLECRLAATRPAGAPQTHPLRRACRRFLTINRDFVERRLAPLFTCKSSVRSYQMAGIGPELIAQA